MVQTTRSLLLVAAGGGQAFLQQAGERRRRGSSHQLASPPVATRNGLASLLLECAILAYELCYRPGILNMRLIRFFIILAGFLLLVTAMAKIISSTGNAQVLKNIDPILSISFQKVFWIVGAIELIVSLICLFGKRTRLQALLAAWLSTSFVVYRLGLLWVGYRKPCSCMGNLTDALRISPEAADAAMKIILAYLLICSYSILFWLWQQSKKVSAPALAK